MPSIYLQEDLDPHEKELLTDEFPHYNILTQCDKESWSHVEILYGNQLSEKQLRSAPRLRWIHSPSTDLDHLCLEVIRREKNVLVTLSKGKNVSQIAEFVMGAMLAFGKQLFLWREVVHDPEEFWDWPLRETMWTLKGKTLLQVGLGEVGTEIVRQANALGMRTWGMRKTRSFHPFCDTTYHLGALHSLLPAADVVCLALPKTGEKDILLGKKEFESMKRDSIFIMVGSAEAIDEEGLAEVGKKGKFRGVLLDAFQRPPPAKHSPLWEIPGVILTPSISHYPPSPEHLAFRLFRQNLRSFSKGLVSEMKNLVSL